MKCRSVSPHRVRLAQQTSPTTLADDVAGLILARWGFPPTEGNIEAIQHAFSVPLRQMEILAAKIPRWILVSRQEQELRRAA